MYYFKFKFSNNEKTVNSDTLKKLCPKNFFLVWYLIVVELSFKKLVPNNL